VSIGDSFMFNTFAIANQLTSLSIKMPLNITSIGTNFMQQTFNGAFRLTNIKLFDTSNWNITSIP